MATAYPSGIDEFNNPLATDSLDSVSVPHASQHSDANDAIEAIETTLGVNPQGEATDVADRFTAIEGALVDINISAVSASTAEQLVAGTDPGTVDDSAAVGYVKFVVDGTDYAFPVYAINA